MWERERESERQESWQERQEQQELQEEAGGAGRRRWPSSPLLQLLLRRHLKSDKFCPQVTVARLA